MTKHDGGSRGDGPPAPAMVHLSGPRRGATVRLRGEQISLGHVGTSADAAEVGQREEDEKPFAYLERRGLTYRLNVSDEGTVWVNGEEVEEITLASGDVLEMGQGGPLLRFRLYESGIPPHKSVTEAFSDCLDCARYGSRSLLGRATIFLSSMPRELFTRTSLAFRAGMITAVLVLLGSTAFLVHRSLELESRLAHEQTRVEGLRSLVEQTGARAISPGELAEIRRELDRTLAEARERLDSLEARNAAAPRIIAEASRAVAYIQGSYRFLDPLSERHLRIQVDQDGKARMEGPGRASVGLGGQGPFLEPNFTGSAFVVGDGSLLVTNRHVARPWEFEEGARDLVEQGFVPQMRRLVAWFPELKEPLYLEAVAVADSSDVAVLRSSRNLEDRQALELAPDRPGAGEEVLLLGYPLGTRALMARADMELLGNLTQDDRTDFWGLAERLAERGVIAPLASRGIVGQVSEEMVVYDAETAVGGSGGPVLDMDGRVVAVNTGTMPEFGGSNLGVSVRRIRALLETVR